MTKPAAHVPKPVMNGAPAQAPAIQLRPLAPLELFDAGYCDLVTIAPPDGRAGPGSKIDLGKRPALWDPAGWHGYAWTGSNLSRAELRQQLCHGAGVGLRTANYPTIDVDVAELEVSDLVAHVLSAQLGDSSGSLLRRYGRFPRFAAPFRLEGDPYSKIVLTLQAADGSSPGKIELLANGQQFVVHGQHATAGRPYCWTHDGTRFGGVELLAKVPPAELPALSRKLYTNEIIPALTAALAERDIRVVQQGTGTAVRRANIDQVSLRAPSLEKLREVVNMIPNDERDYDDYVRMGYAIKAAAGQENEVEGYEIWETWCGRATAVENNPDLNSEKTWPSLKPPFEIGYDYLSSRARGHGYSDVLGVFDADLNAAPTLSAAQAVAPLPTDGERIAALTADPDAVFLAEAMTIRGNLWTRWGQLDAAAAMRDPLASIFAEVFNAARTAPADRPAAFRFAVGAAMAGRAEWDGLSLPDQTLLVKAAHSLLREQVQERRAPRLVTTGKPQAYLIDHILPKGALVGVVGLPGQGKSWLALEMAAHIASEATGRFGSLAVNERGSVYYLLSEDAQGFRARKERWEQEHGPAPRLHLFDEVPLLTAPIADLLHFLKEARAQAGEDPVLVVIDVFADTLVGQDENQAATMVPALRRARIIGRLLNATVLVVHHASKQRPEDARGSVAFKGALDVMNAVVQDEKGTIHFRPSKYRSSPLRDELRFHIDSDVLCPGPAPKDTSWPDTYSGDEAVNIAGRAIREIAGDGMSVTRSDLAAELRATRPEWFDDQILGAANVRQRISRAIRGAQSTGFIAPKGQRYTSGPNIPPAAVPAMLEGVDA